MQEKLIYNLTSDLELWAIDLRSYYGKEKKLIEVLSRSEKERAFRFKFDYLRQNYIASHALLRYLIVQYLSNVSPAAISFCYGPFGKPFLQNTALYFNMSHSNYMVLYAFSRKWEVGVDIEYINRDLSIDHLPLSVFPLSIQEEITSSSPVKQKEVFYKKWVQMEACLKAIGVGLHSDSQQLEMPNYFQRDFYEVTLPEGYVGAVAYKTPFCLAKTSLEHPVHKIKAAINIEIPPSIIGIL